MDFHQAIAGCATSRFAWLLYLCTHRASCDSTLFAVIAWIICCQIFFCVRFYPLYNSSVTAAGSILETSSFHHRILCGLLTKDTNYDFKERYIRVHCRPVESYILFVFCLFVCLFVLFSFRLCLFDYTLVSSFVLNSSRNIFSTSKFIQNLNLHHLYALEWWYLCPMDSS